jgi:tetratricopeptide (TPR) repeat protein
VTVPSSGLGGRGERDHPSFARPIPRGAGIIDGCLLIFHPPFGLALEHRRSLQWSSQEILDHVRSTRGSERQWLTCRLTQNKMSQWSGRCWTRAILGALQAALEDCNKALMSEPDSAGTYDSHGLIHLKMGRLGAAIDDCNSALRLDPSRSVLTPSIQPVRRYGNSASAIEGFAT